MSPVAKHNAGFSLVEAMMALVVVGVIMAGAYTFFGQTFKNANALSSKADRQGDTRALVDLMRDITTDADQLGPTGNCLDTTCVLPGVRGPATITSGCETAPAPVATQDFGAAAGVGCLPAVACPVGERPWVRVSTSDKRSLRFPAAGPGAAKQTVGAMACFSTQIITPAMLSVNVALTVFTQNAAGKVSAQVRQLLFPIGNVAGIPVRRGSGALP